MTSHPSTQSSISRRGVLRRGVVLSSAIGLGVASTSGQAMAMNKAELIEAMASEAGLSKADAKRALDAFTDTTTKALKKGDRVALVGFGAFNVTKRAKRGNGRTDDDPVDFEACPAYAEGLGLSPGEGNNRRAPASSRCHRADLQIDAERLARETQRHRDSGLSKADAKRALDAFIDTTTKALKKGDRVALVGFGSFSISKRSARKGRNPATGKEIKIPAKNVVKFKAGADLSKAVN